MKGGRVLNRGERRSAQQPIYKPVWDLRLLSKLFQKNANQNINPKLVQVIQKGYVQRSEFAKSPSVPIQVL